MDNRNTSSESKIWNRVLMLTSLAVVAAASIAIASLAAANSVDIAEWLDYRRAAGNVMVVASLGIVVAPILLIFLGNCLARNRTDRIQSTIWILIACMTVCSVVVCYSLGSACAMQISG